MKILKFGGKSLANGEAIKSAISIITASAKKDNLAIVVSARGNDTDRLLELALLAKNGESFNEGLNEFINSHKAIAKSLDFYLEYLELYNQLKAIQALKFTSNEILDQIVSFGELISSRVVAYLLQQKGIPATSVDARQLIEADLKSGEIVVNLEASKLKTKHYFEKLNKGTITVVTGFIASDRENKTITLGRNGSNYTATLLANFLDATEVQNWTNINGFFTADPKLVENALSIEHLSFKEANELAQFGANIIHPKTIKPLVEKNIPIYIKNSFQPEAKGTLIDQNGSGNGIKAVNVIKECALISIEGNGMADKVGIDAKIFSTLSANNISVKVISQASSERSIGFIVDLHEAKTVKEVIEQNFKQEIKQNDISKIEVNTEIGIIAITGRHNYALEKAIAGLRKNKIWLHLIANSISGEHISLVIDKKHIKKAVNVVHNHVFGSVKTLNIFAFGKGTVGKTFINQILKTKDEIITKRKLRIKIIGIADSKKFIIENQGLNFNWENALNESNKTSNLKEIIDELSQSELENIVIIDNTANKDIAEKYDEFIKKGFDVIASNKIANALPFEKYKQLRNYLIDKNKHFLYETNVGAGLPVIDTIKHLVEADEKIRSINGVFSGSLSYIFNRFSVENKSFSEILIDAKNNGYTEPDPREDLGGDDVARKLLILAREIGIEANFEDIKIESLIPEKLNNIDKWDDFQKAFESLDKHFSSIKKSLNQKQVLRYVGSLDYSGKMEVKLITSNSDEPIANLKEADSMIQIYTDSYGEKPIIIQGAGAGANVTARGVYSDLIRLGSYLN